MVELSPTEINRLLVDVTRKVRRRFGWLPIGEAESASQVGVAHALRDCNPAKCKSPVSWVRYHGYLRTVGELRSSRWLRHTGNRGDIVAPVEMQVGEFSGVGADSKDTIGFDDLLALCPDTRTRTVLRWYYEHSMSHREIGLKLGITESGAREIILRGRKLIKQQLIGR